MKSIYPLVLAAAMMSAAVPARAQDGQRIELVFALDTTGSMGGLIEGAKQKIWSIADEIRHENPNSDVRIGLVGYRDRGDVYVTRETPISNDIHAVYGRLLEFQAGGGGDFPESVNEALHVAVTKMNWTRDATTTRIVFLVGDAPPHMDYPQDILYPDTLKIAARDGIVVNAVQAGGAPETARVWRDIAQLGGGAYIPIPQTGGVVIIETPFDDDILIIQKKLTGTIIPYGSRAQQAAVAEKAAKNVAAPAPASADIASYSMRGGAAKDRKVVTGEGDLANEIQSGRVTVDTLKVEDLPAPMQAMAPAERESYINGRIAEREKLQAELAGVVAKRDAYLADKRKAGAAPKDSFDETVNATVRKQIKKL